MDVDLHQFLRKHHHAIRDLVEQGALAGDGCFVQLTPEARRQQSDQYTEIVIQALLTGHLACPVLDAMLDPLVLGEIPAAELLVQVAWTYEALESYLRRELAVAPELCDAVLTRMNQIYGRLMRELIAHKLDPQRRPATAGAILVGPPAGQG